MAEAYSVPVLFVTDTIVLPGMVVPIALDDAARAAIDAAQASESGQLLIAPPARGPLPVARRDRQDRAGRAHRRGRHRRGGARRAPGPDRGRHVRARRGAVGAGDPGPRRRDHRRDQDAGRGVQEAAAGHAATPRGLGDHRLRQPADRPVGAGRHLRLRVLPDQRAEAPAAGNGRCGRAAAGADRLDQLASGRGRGQRQDRRGRARGHGEDAEGIPAAPAAGRDPQGAGRGRTGRVR